ncbi:hypothetical protein ACTDI4_02630 [Mesorhizobium sp. PUT5]
MSDYKPLARQEAIVVGAGRRAGQGAAITPGRGAPEGRDISMSA